MGKINSPRDNRFGRIKAVGRERPKNDQRLAREKE